MTTVRPLGLTGLLDKSTLDLLIPLPSPQIRLDLIANTMQ